MGRKKRRTDATLKPPRNTPGGWLSMRPPLAWELQLLEGCLRGIPEFVRKKPVAWNRCLSLFRPLVASCCWCCPGWLPNRKEQPTAQKCHCHPSRLAQAPSCLAQIKKICGHHIEVGVSRDIDFRRAGNEGCLQPHCLCASQIVEMRCHHHDLVGRQAQEAAGSVVYPVVRLVRLQKVPIKSCPKPSRRAGTDE